MRRERRDKDGCKRKGGKFNSKRVCKREGKRNERNERVWKQL